MLAVPAWRANEVASEEYMPAPIPVMVLKRLPHQSADPQPASTFLQNLTAKCCLKALAGLDTAAGKKQAQRCAHEGDTTVLAPDDRVHGRAIDAVASRRRCTERRDTQRWIEHNASRATCKLGPLPSLNWGGHLGTVHTSRGSGVQRQIPWRFTTRKETQRAYCAVPRPG
ncbi:MAG TPA: hypothetical protein VG013_24735, partial [Gemmataceae bacterium]|nr:hypothetical protein [Gemmataceae bacterium]